MAGSIKTRTFKRMAARYVNKGIARGMDRDKATLWAFDKVLQRLKRGDGTMPKVAG